MLTTKEAIEKRRSIRKFKKATISQDIIYELLESARLAPSACNAQPWRFKIVTDTETKEKLKDAAFNQIFISQAPTVIICCANIDGYLNRMSLGVRDLGNIQAIKSDVVNTILGKIEGMKRFDAERLGMLIGLNVAIAIEHIVLRALDFGLGTCWIKSVDATKVRKIFGWEDNICIVAILPIGYPDEAPSARKRISLENIIL